REGWGGSRRRGLSVVRDLATTPAVRANRRRIGCYAARRDVDDCVAVVAVAAACRQHRSFRRARRGGGNTRAGGGGAARTAAKGHYLCGNVAWRREHRVVGRPRTTCRGLVVGGGACRSGDSFAAASDAHIASQRIGRGRTATTRSGPRDPHGFRGVARPEA